MQGQDAVVSMSWLRLLQVILNPGDALGLGTDYTKATPSAADAARLSAALGLQV